MIYVWIIAWKGLFIVSKNCKNAYKLTIVCHLCIFWYWSLLQGQVTSDKNNLNHLESSVLSENAEIPLSHTHFPKSLGKFMDPHNILWNWDQNALRRCLVSKMWKTVSSCWVNKFFWNSIVFIWIWINTNILLGSWSSDLSWKCHQIWFSTLSFCSQTR